MFQLYFDKKNTIYLIFSNVFITNFLIRVNKDKDNEKNELDEELVYKFELANKFLSTTNNNNNGE